MEKVSTHIKRTHRDRLKVRAAKERKSVFALLDECITEFLSKKKGA